MSDDARPRVFHLITRLLKGGAEEKTITAVTELDGYDFTVGHGAEYDPDQVERLEQQGIETKQFGLIRHYNPITSVPAVISLARYLRQSEFDIVHTHSTEAGIIGRFAAALAGVPIVIHTVHGVPFSTDRNEFLNRFVLACERRAATVTDHIVVNADAIREEYLERHIGQREQYTTVYSGVDIERFREASPTLDLPGKRPRVVMIGRLAKGKGFDVLLEAASELGDSSFSICLVGDGPQYEEIEAEINSRELENTVHLLGYRDDVPQILSASDLLVLPSFREGTPRVITEAMASGLPVIATDIAGIPEQVEHGESGYLIPPGDPEALTERLQELLTDDELRNLMGAAGRERAERFSISAMLSDLDTLYQQCLGRSYH
jgi:glycosyltransferase involved in cell wall biosynthesis